MQLNVIVLFRIAPEILKKFARGLSSHCPSIEVTADVLVDVMKVVHDATELLGSYF